MKVFPVLIVSWLMIEENICSSLLDSLHHDVRTMPPYRASDADVGMRSANYIGSFRGMPIKTRQEYGFIDENGVPVPMLPNDNFSGELREDQLFSQQRLKKMKIFVDNLSNKLNLLLKS